MKMTKKLLSLLFVLFIAASLSGCGSDEAVEAITGILDPDAPVLGEIGNKTVTSGDTLTFPVTASDPNNLSFTLETDLTDDPYVGNGNNAEFSQNPNNMDQFDFTWDTTGVTAGNYSVEFSVTNAANLSDSETIIITVQSVQTQFTEGQTLYNNSCRGSDCHRNEDDNLAEGARFGVLCLTEAQVKEFTESGPGIMPTFGFTAAQEAAISYYLNTVRPADC